jgi:monoamine oxidase
MSQHPEYGIDTSSYSDKIFFSSTEFSFEEGGYLEGAVLQAQKIAAKLLE